MADTTLMDNNILKVDKDNKANKNDDTYKPQKINSSINSKKKILIAVGVLSLGVLALSVFTLLPKMVNPPSPELISSEKRVENIALSTESSIGKESKKSKSVPSVQLDESTWNSAQTNEVRKKSQEVLNQLLQLDKALKEKKVGTWAKQLYSEGQKIAETADQYYKALDYPKALAHYQQAFAQFTKIKDSAPDIAKSAYRESQAFVEKRQPLLAEEQASIAHAIEADNEDYHQQLTHAKNLQLALPLIVEAETLEVNDDLPSAIESAQKALDIDVTLPLSKNTLERLQKKQNDRRIKGHISDALSFSDQKAFSKALNAIQKAKRLDPNSAQLSQIENNIRASEKDFSIQRNSSLAQAAEKKEQWSEAAAFYQRILNSYPSLSEYQEKQRQASDRAALYDQLASTIKTPNDITKSARRLQEAKSLLQVARDASSPNYPQLNKKIDQLSSILVLANTPKPVYITSDNKTEIVIYRVGKLGALNSETLALNPGTYTFLGTRSGYRDVRLDITIGVNDQSKEVTLICEEKVSSG